MKKKLLAAAIIAGLTLTVAAPAFAAATPEDEIKDLKVRIAALEKQLQALASDTKNIKEDTAKIKKTAPTIKITGESRMRYQDADHSTAFEGSNGFDMRQRLYLTSKINDHTSYTARIEGSFKNGDSGTATTNGTMRFNRNFFTLTDVGFDKAILGRMPAMAGKTMNVGKSSDNDGVMIFQKLGDVNLTGFVFTEVSAGIQLKGIYAGIDLNKNADLEIGFTKGDKPAGLPEAKSFDIGAYTALGGDFSLAGEFVHTQNSGVFADGNAWAVQLVKGVKTKKMGTITTGLNIVDMTKPHTTGYMLGYRKIEDNALWNNGLGSIFNASCFNGKDADNVKGVYFGIQNVLAKNTILSLEYQDLETENGSPFNGAGTPKDEKYVSAHVQYYF